MQCEEPDDYIMMKDVYILSKKLNAGDTTFESVGIQSLSQLKNNNRVVTKQEFIDYYILLLPYCSNPAGRCNPHRCAAGSGQNRSPPARGVGEPFPWLQ